jgi:hypothetical protein
LTRNELTDLLAAAEDRGLAPALAREATPELTDIRIVRSRRDFDPMMPRFVMTFLDRMAFIDHPRS